MKSKRSMTKLKTSTGDTRHHVLDPHRIVCYGAISANSKAAVAQTTAESTASYLWMPSNVSTDQSNWSHIQSEVDRDVNKSPSKSELVPLTSGHLDHSSDIIKGSQQNGRGCYSTKVLVNGSACISVVLILLWMSMTSPWTSKFIDHDALPVLPHHEVSPMTPTNSNSNPYKKLPLSELDPVHDLGLYSYKRAEDTSPKSALQYGSYHKNNKNKNKNRNFPTNSWYQNLIMFDNKTVGDNIPNGDYYRVYTIPYLIDVSGPIPGIRIHANQIGASSNVIQVHINAEFGLIMGKAVNPIIEAMTDEAPVSPPVSTTTTTTRSNQSEIIYTNISSIPNHYYQYTIHQATPLSVTLEWDDLFMKSTLSKGMPYATMIYDMNEDDSKAKYVPTIASAIGLAQNPIIDESLSLNCMDLQPNGTILIEPMMVQRDIELFFAKSDFKWIMFVSEPVYVQCIITNRDPSSDGIVQIQVLEYVTEPNIPRPLVIRTALSKLCTTGRDPIYCHQEKMHPTSWFLGQGNYDQQLRHHVHLFPGPNTSFDYEVIEKYNDNNEPSTVSILKFDWNVQNMRNYALHPIPLMDTTTIYQNDSNVVNNVTITMSYASATEPITYALPHHFDMISEPHPTDFNIYCANTLIGPACLYEGSVWHLNQDIPDIEFNGSRPPAPWALAALVNSLQTDLQYQLPQYYQNGIGDTYFSGKMIAKSARILLIADEVTSLCTSASNKSIRPEYVDACNGVTLPSLQSQLDALENLKRSVEIWINGSAVTPFVYDEAWGGMVSCGCEYQPDTQTCGNQFPYCTGFYDPGLNFGNAFYNDMHFHYGYHIYGAAVVSYFDPDWGRQMWEQVLLYIRNIANPSDADTYFPTWRHKDWFQGHSWASGIATLPPNGKNQESSSESIAAYEAIALYGKAMKSAWKDYSTDRMNTAIEVERVGQIMTASELRSAQFYWHVKTDTTIKIYPSVYAQHAIGILWQTMAQFQTWFGNRPFYAIGIQLLPLTPIAEFRDSITWSKQLYLDYATSCEEDDSCESNGWSVLQLALLATVGHAQDAFNRVLTLDPDIFESAGGNGHSMTNTIWYLASRREVDLPLPLTNDENQNETETSDQIEAPLHNRSKFEVYDCGRPELCIDFVLDTIAGLYTCRQRMNWLIQERSYTEKQACYEVAVKENPLQCGKCNPDSTPDTEIELPRCTACTPDQCNSNLDRCPQFPKTYICTEGNSIGGCSENPWDIPSVQCSACCELSTCPKLSPAAKRAKIEQNCPVCTKDICQSTMNNCPTHGGSQFLCLAGKSKYGCSAFPWEIESGQCDKCCQLLEKC